MAEILGWNHPSLKIPKAPIPCMMFSSTSYDQEFPSFDRKTDPVTKVSTKPHIIPTESDEFKEQYEESSTEAEKSYSDEEEEVGYIDISNILMARSTEEPFYDSPVEEEPLISRTVLGTLHQEFIGEGKIIERKIKQEFFEMRCCSLKIKDLDRHFKRMNQRFYLLNGLNDPSLKNTYVASLPEEIQPELNKMVATAQMVFSTMSMGQIHQFPLEVVEKLCRQHQYFYDIMNKKVKYSKACKKPYLEIKCKEKACHYSPNKKKILLGDTKGKRRPLKFLRKSRRKGKSRGQRCFIRNQIGNFAKNCPKKSEKAIRLISHLQIDEETKFALNQTDSSNEESSTSPIPVFSIQEKQSIRPAIPQPCVEIQVLEKKFENPIKVIAFIDTGAQRMMTDLDILPEEYWKKEVAYFVATDGKIFRTDLVTHAPIGIKFFPDCIIWTKVIGSKLSDRAPPEVGEFKQKISSLCADNHENFKHPYPLWKNKEYFVDLLFRLNEDINPTKATHPGMSPSDLPAARQECQDLLRQGLIESTQSNWASQSFCVEKRAEKLRGKKSTLSLFEKTMTMIFEPILENTLVYIDDIFLFSKDIVSHKNLLNQFFEIANQHGIMLSEKKIQLTQSQIDFLGMHFSKGTYQPLPHIAQELLNFPDEFFTVK
ncbi:hypothetical protein JHK82_050131 [Glycine max]|nr:hypothetical protein JHK82_050131 [Glycine max]